MEQSKDDLFNAIARSAAFTVFPGSNAVAEWVWKFAARNWKSATRDKRAALDELTSGLSDAERKDPSVIAARMNAEAAITSAEIGRGATVVAAMFGFVASALGAGASNWLYDLLTK